MNPIFQRRYKNNPAASSINTNGTKRGALSRSQSKSKSPSREDEVSSSIVEPLSPPSNARARSQRAQSFDGEFHTKKPTGFSNKMGTISPNFDESPVSLAQSLLETKQNILAHGSLTPAENQKRNKSKTFPSPEESEVKGGQPIFALKKNPSHISGPKAPEPVLELCDIEDEDFGYSEEDFEEKTPLLLFIRNPGQVQSNRSQLDLKTWKELKVAVLGTNGMLQDGWIGQGFVFNPNVPYGLLQHKGGSCGVLAVVQALFLRNLLFGSEYCKDDFPLEGFAKSLKELPISFNNSFTNCNSLSNQNENWFREIISKRSEGVVSAIVEILWRCATSSIGHEKSSQGGSNSEDRGTVKICLQGNEPGTELVKIDKLDELKDFVTGNFYRFDCIGLVYSAVLSRGIDRIQEDMDFPNSPLLGQHGYCSQELVNLLLFGKCISNAFDNEVALDDKILYGIKGQSDIGFLSLFEHYGSCEVGSFLKSPKYPLWIVCSESHFSVLFSYEMALVSRDKEQFIQSNGFHLFYYDGLAKQQNIIPLTISFDNNEAGYLSLPKSGFGGNSTVEKYHPVDDEHLVPPLEKCIRTKWKNATVFWNGTEPIL